jgi:hypothetical protein
MDDHQNEGRRRKNLYSRGLSGYDDADENSQYRARRVIETLAFRRSAMSFY